MLMGAGFPAEVALHAVLLQLSPDSLVAIGCDSAAAVLQQRGRIERREYESGRRLILQRCRRAIDHRIEQPARAVHEGWPAVALAVHLVQPAEFGTRPP